jgi:integrase-like protein
MRTRGKEIGVSNDLTELPFANAATVWLESRRPYISEATQRDYTIYIRTLNAFFGEMRLGEIFRKMLAQSGGQNE